MVRATQRLHAAPRAATPSQAPRAAAPSEAPRTGWLDGQPTLFQAHQPPYGELALVGASDDLAHVLDWQHQRPVALLKNVQRLTAPNPGMMTGPGTNSYLVGDAASGYIVIDPGPNEHAHLERLWQAAAGQIRFIVCTHSHPDHSPGAAPLQARCDMRPPILGLPSGAHAAASAFFRPDQALAHGQVLSLQGGAHSHSLQVVHTPGHAANHLCLLLLEDGLLFSGDHVLNGSTTVVNPPDGDMTAYLDSLDALAQACAEHGIDFILPAHGYVLGFAAQAIAQLKAHRLRREAKIAAAMQTKPDGGLDDWLALAYDDVPPRLWPVAARSLLAHVQRIQRTAAGA